MGYTLNFGPVWASFGSFLSGLALGLELAIAGIAIGAVAGLVLAFAATGPSRLIRRLVIIYVGCVRNLPILVLVLLVYFGLPQIGLRFGKIESFIAALAFCAAAYLTEVFRGGISAVPKGVIEAGSAIGLTKLQISAYLVMPIMFRQSLPAMGSTFISLFKDTSIATAIAIPELTFQTRKLNIDTFRVVEAWSTATVLYVATCALLAFGLRRLERRFPRF